MKKSIIYTCTGDSGMTSLVGGKRVAKNDIRIEAYGSVDELNSQIGLLASQPDISDTHRQLLVVTQNKLFNLGAYLATEMINGEPAVLRGLDLADIEAIERAIDEIDASLPPLNNFVLPGGCQSAAVAHGTAYSQAETAGIGQQAHYDNCYGCTENEIGQTTAKTVPCFIAH